MELNSPRRYQNMLIRGPEWRPIEVLERGIK